MEPEFAVDEALQQSWEDGIDNILDIASEYFYPLPTTETDLELFEDALESGDRTAAYELAMSVWARGHPLAEGAIVRVFVSFPDSDSRMSTLSRCVEQWDEAAGKNATEEINGKAALANSCAHVTDSADEARALMIAMQSSAVSQTLGSVLCSKFVLEGRPRFPARDTPFAVLIRASERCCFVALEELSVYCPTFVPSRAKELTHKAAQIGSLVAIADSALFILREKNKSLRKVAWRLAEKSAKGWCHRGMFALGQLHESEGDRVSASLYYARAVHCRSLLLGVTIGLSHSLLTEYENALHRVSDGRDQDVSCSSTRLFCFLSLFFSLFLNFLVYNRLRSFCSICIAPWSSSEGSLLLDRLL